MPKIKGLTQEQKDRGDYEKQSFKIAYILFGYMGRMTIVALADKVDIHHESLRRKFQGETKWDALTLAKVCDVLGVGMEDRADMLTRY